MEFQFRFQAVLQIRLAQRDAVRRAIGNTTSEIEQVRQRASATQVRIRTEHARQRKERSESVNLVALQNAERDNGYLAEVMNQLSARIGKLEEKLAEQKSDLTRSEVEVKRLETLREAELAEHFKRLAKRDQRDADDINNARHRTQKRA